MKRYYKEENGNIVWFRNSINLNGFKIINPTEEQIIEAGYVEYVAPEPKPIPEEVLIERARRRKLDELHRYDESSEVNDCIIVYQGEEIHYWANKTERNDLKNAVRDCIAMGREYYRLDLRDKGISLTIQCELLLGMMATLEVYAIDSFNKTTDHEYAIKALPTEAEIDAYEFRGVGYPEVPRFEL